MSGGGATFKEYYESYWDREDPSPLTDPLTGARVRLLVDVLERAGARTVLDAGCGAGGVVAALRERAYEATGMDIAGGALERARNAHPDAPFVEHSVEDLPWPPARGSVDAVVAFEVIEHLLQPARLLRGAHEALRTGGVVVISTPYHGRLKNLALALTSFDKHFDVTGDHVRFFSDAALRRLLEAEGFEVERVEHLGRIRGLWKGVFVSARKR